MGESYGRQIKAFNAGNSCNLFTLEKYLISQETQTHVKPPKDFPSRSRAAQMDQSCGCPITGSVQSRTGQGFRQPDLVEGLPAHSRGVGPDDREGFLSTQTILWFCDPCEWPFLEQEAFMCTCDIRGWFQTPYHAHWTARRSRPRVLVVCFKEF